LRHPGEISVRILGEHPIRSYTLASGRIADALGYQALFGLATALSAMAVLATLVLLQRVPPTRTGRHVT
jgi:hypothetical protein